ncbi:helix-turn-helix domain-containing protein [Bradyrhizobium sp. Tv2a-2]|uniref:AraC family transcriptional regulator n=1 Tax=Bradyrhizobium sp. Tv2a-2 TaxID=113395 RepID=UPI0003F77E9D|nr:helix-turn-helix domain-containing protein [Bradyrhizobium sp. Tv2a-2]
MSLASIDIALRGASIAMLLVLAASLLRDFRDRVAGRLAVAFALGSAAHAATLGFGAQSPVSGWHAALIALSTGDVVVFWLFCRALFDDAFVLRLWHALVWGTVVAFSFVNCLVIAPGGHAHAAVVGINLLTLGFIGLALAQTVSSWSADLVEGRRRLRVFIVVIAALYGGLHDALQIFTFGTDAADIANTVNAALLAGIVAWISIAMMQVTAGDLFAEPEMASVASVPVASINPDTIAADQKLIDALMRLMADERVYRHDDLTIGTLATRLKIPEYRLRRLINQKLGYRNFNSFLNNHRIEEAKAALADPDQAEVPVITIAMDAGFQSLGPFNRAFKAMTGVTPSEYRKLKASAA